MTTECKPAPDPKAWAKQFAAIAAGGDTNAMAEALNAVSAPELDRQNLKPAIDMVTTLTHGLAPKSSSILRDEQLGEALYRVTFAVHYGGLNYMFYQLDMVRIEDGWALVNFFIGSNLNQILSRPWPFNR